MPTEWYYADGNSRLGPFALDQLRARIASGALRADQLVWNESMPQWALAGTVPALFPPQQEPTADRQPAEAPAPGQSSPHTTRPVAPGVSLGDEEPGGFLGRILGILDLKFQRYFTLMLVQMLWAGYLLLGAVIASYLLLSILIPGTMAGFLSDVASAFYDPRAPSSSDSGPVFAQRVGVFFFVFLTLGFIGLNLRVFLEMLSVQFRVVELLKELKEGQGTAKGDGPA